MKGEEKFTHYEINREGTTSHNWKLTKETINLNDIQRKIIAIHKYIEITVTQEWSLTTLMLK